MMFEEFFNDVDIMLSTLWVPYRQVPLGREFNDVFVIDDLGVVISVIAPGDYSYTLNKLSSVYGRYRLIFLTTEDLLYEVKYDVIWELMRSGYMRYLRTSFNRQFNSLLNDESFARRIVKERLKCWADQDKYKYMIAESEISLQVPVSQVLNHDPSFFDYMPEKTGEQCIV